MTLTRWCAGAVLTLSLVLTGCNGTADSPLAQPVPDFVLQGSDAPVELGSSLAVSTSLGAAQAYAYRWDFGDGFFSAEASPSHVYATPGVYDLSVTVSTPEGNTRRAARSVQVGRFAMVQGKLCMGANHTGWCLQHPGVSGQGASIASVQWFDARNGLNLGYQGRVVRTADGGATWVDTTLPALQQLVAVRFADRNTGWLLGTGRDSVERVFLTRDSGLSWAEQRLPSVNTTPFELEATRLTVVSASVVVINNPGSSLVTQDAGSTWTLLPYRHDAITLPGGIRWRLKAVEGGTSLLKSTDLGQTERAVLGSAAGIVEGPFFADDVHAWVVCAPAGRERVLMRTVDGGDTWSEAAPFPYAFDRRLPLQMRFFDASNGWAELDAGQGAKIHTTRDGGVTWVPIQPIPGGLMVFFTPLSADAAYTSNPDYRGNAATVYVTRDQTATWKGYAVPQESGAGVRSAELLQNGGLRLNYDKRAYETQDDGSSWQLVRGLADNNIVERIGLQGIWFFDARRGFATAARSSERSTILLGSLPPVLQQTVDGGASWTMPTVPGPLQSVLAAQIYSTDLGWAISQDGSTQANNNVAPPQFRRTTDGGTTWQVQADAPSGSFSAGLFEFHFIDPKQGWGLAVRPFPDQLMTDVYRSVDAGSTWQRTGTLPASVGRLRFFDASHGLAGGGGPGLWRTTDGGATWQQVDNRMFLRQVRYLDADTVWALSDAAMGSVFYKSVDGGASWQPVALPPAAFHDFHFATKNTGWIVGRLGSIFRTDDGGATWAAQESGVTADLLGITAVDAQTLWVAGAFGTILATNSGGR